ncbi:MAG: TIM barrel protein [Sphingomonadales bacterium]|nr:TIM barrel protein [Sphingomonadales bacterium]
MHERLSVNSLCFPGKGWAELAGLWRECDAARVSFLSGLLGDDFAEADATLRALGKPLETITHLFTTGSITSDPAPMRARLDRVIDFAAAHGGRSIYMMTGGHGGLDWEDAAATFAAAVAPCVARAERAGVHLLIEPCPPLYADGHLAHSLRDTVLLAEIAGIGVCIDLFACWAEAGLKETFARAMPRCHLIQVSDYVPGDRAYPCRAIPGDGAIPLQRLIGLALDAGYTGAFDFELIGPRIDATGHLEAVQRAGDVMGAMLHDLGI